MAKLPVALSRDNLELYEARALAILRPYKLFISRLSQGGYAMVEDIGDTAIPVWKLGQGQLGRSLASFIFRGKIADAFVIRASNTTNV